MPKDPPPVKVARYARRLLEHYDTNGDGTIDTAEQAQMQGEPSAADYNADGKIGLDELAAYMADYGRDRRMLLTGSMVEEAVAVLPPLYIPAAELDAMAAAEAAAQQPQAVPVALAAPSAPAADGEPAASEVTDAGQAEVEGTETAKTDTPAGDGADKTQPAQTSSKRFVTPQARLAALPEWFLAGDANGDGQLTVAEYTPDSDKARLAEFARYDRNKDGVLTAQECPKKKK